jgi:hypothetical protein
LPTPTPNRARILRLIEAITLLAAAFLFALHYLHLRADFPNHSPWVDWSKYTDEGWYGDAAIRHFQLGHWYVPGDFNPAAALPVWPLVEAALFHFTHVSLTAARALTVSVFGAILLASYLLLHRWHARRNDQTHPSLAPALAVLLLASSPFCMVFTRLAILEPLLILLTLLALHAVTSVSPNPQTPLRSARTLLPILALGILLPTMVLTKTTALFLVPAIAFLLFASTGYSIPRFLRSAIPAGCLAAALWCCYFFLIVRPHYLADYRYLFSANAYTGITLATATQVLSDTFTDGLWIGPLLYPLAVLAVILAFVRLRHLRDQPLIPTLLLWAIGYAAFLAYHDNLQPRYYLVIAVPLTLLVALTYEPAWHWLRPSYHATHSTPARPVLAILTFLAFTVTILTSTRQTLSYLRHPEYTLVNAANQVARIVRADPTHSNLVLSISGSDLSLITGLPSICDDFGTDELVDRIQKFHPGWYAAWNEIDDDKMDALTPIYTPIRVAAFPAMDDPDRNLLILYRLDPTPPTPPSHPKRHHKPIPRPLQTKMGQQPSVLQLEH